MKISTIDRQAIVTNNAGDKITLSLEDIARLAMYSRRHMAQLASLTRAGPVPLATIEATSVHARLDAHKTTVVLEIRCVDGTQDGYALPIATASALSSELLEAVAAASAQSGNHKVQ